MFLNDKFFVASLLIASTAVLSGCSLGFNNTETKENKVSSVTSTPPATQTQVPTQNSAAMNYSYAESQAVLNTAMSKPPTEQKDFDLNESNKESFKNLSTCIKELNALKALSPKDYNRLVGSFKEVSDINQLYKQVATTASPDTIELLQMAIEAKTKVLCAKVRYNSVLSTESTLEKISGL
ncbi:hypothetical protein [Providencia sneebia]|uniref:Lipoprotein n=1 Tax=Providencia sneebia DSM 19967 TaxID=1141660 RepID=K8WI46_9GAMM|nr:hypothetical protein OO7_12914 [Providencia sneebia DSM 19967]